MKRWRTLCAVFLLMGIASVLSVAYGAEKKKSLIGREIMNFTLPSTEDRVINYAEEYYGKSNLIITFFPAAYTPI